MLYIPVDWIEEANRRWAHTALNEFCKAGPTAEEIERRAIADAARAKAEAQQEEDYRTLSRQDFTRKYSSMWYDWNSPEHP